MSSMLNFFGKDVVCVLHLCHVGNLYILKEDSAHLQDALIVCKIFKDVADRFRVQVNKHLLRCRFDGDHR